MTFRVSQWFTANCIPNHMFVSLRYVRWCDFPIIQNVIASFQKTKKNKNEEDDQNGDNGDNDETYSNTQIFPYRNFHFTVGNNLTIAYIITHVTDRWIQLWKWTHIFFFTQKHSQKIWENKNNANKITQPHTEWDRDGIATDSDEWEKMIQS